MPKTEQKIKKETLTDYDIIPEIKNRWSPRVFADTPVSESEIRLLLEAGRWAPSSFNRQPWVFIYGFKGTKEYDRIFNCLTEFNQSWAGNAPVLMLGCFKKTTETGAENFHALHDLGLFTANLTLQAQHNGIAVHQMAGVKYEDAKKEFGFPEDYHVATALAIGYYGGDHNKLTDDLKEQEVSLKRQRKSQDEFVFNGDFKKS